MVTCRERANHLAVMFVVFCHFPKCSSPHQNNGRGGRLKTDLSPPVKYFLLTVPRSSFFCGSFVLFMSCVCHAFTSVHCCLLVTYREGADLLALVGDV